jgi:predicted ribosome quality control (RQC) complex YloA/Tae2 family protein
VTRIPFDSFVLAAVTQELAAFTGGKLQGVRQPSEDEIVLYLYANGKEGMFLLSCDPTFARSYFVTRRPATLNPPPTFCSTLRARIEGAILCGVTQIQGDRILELKFDAPGGQFRLIAELMGKHSNLILVEPGGRVLSAAKWVGASKSSRPIQSGTEYVLPPVLKGGTDLKTSPFYRKLAEAIGATPRMGSPVLSVGNGAYPCSVAALGYPEVSRTSISVALEQHFNQAIPAHETEAVRASLLTQLNRVVLAREVAIADLTLARDSGEKAGRWQRWGELILAYGPSFSGGSNLNAWDYDGTEVVIPVDPELDFKQNSTIYFEKAKKAKARLGFVGEQIARLSAELADVRRLIGLVERAERLDVILELQSQAKQRRWLNSQPVPTNKKEERPYEGHRIRETTSPGGWQILYGENAEANDYLTMRVAKSNDWWLHVRGGTSAHVVIVTRNQPDRVQREALEYAAKIAVLHSVSKHSGFVSVDYTLKKYVRKPKGAAKGSAFYTHEKTLIVD